MRLLLITCAAMLTMLPNSLLHASSAPKPGDNHSACKRIVKRLPGIKTEVCERAELRASGAKSAQGLPILMREIPARKTEGQKTAPIRVMLLGGIHGDELSSSSIVFRWLDLIPGPMGQGFEWIVAPALNPDGLLARKPSRVNANGVDLNRNFPTPDWHKEALKYWASRTGSDPRRFPGRSPLSEPESRWVNDQMQRFRPDVIISVHAPYGVLDFDGNGRPPFQFGRLPLNKVGIYPGSLGNYGGVHKNVPVITIELPNALSIPPQQEIERIWIDMLKWISDNVEPASTAARTAPPAGTSGTPSSAASPPRPPAPVQAGPQSPASPAQVVRPAADAPIRRTHAD